MTTHSSILAWRIPWTEEPGRLQSMGSQRVGDDGAIDCSYTPRIPLSDPFGFSVRVLISRAKLFLIWDSQHLTQILKLLTALISLKNFFFNCGNVYIRFGEGNGTPLQHSCLENPMGRGAW